MIVKKMSILTIAFAVLVTIFTSGELPFSVQAAGNESAYLQLSSDQMIQTATSVLSKNIYLSHQTKVFLQSDGRFFPNSGGTKAMMQINVDNNPAGNISLIDWSNTSETAQHSFNCIAAVTLPAGSHTISLVAVPVSGTFTVGMGSNLCIMANITANMQSVTLNTDTQMYDFTTYNIQPPEPIPHSPLLSCTVNNSAGPVIALASARAYSSRSGDKMLGIFKDGEALPNDQALWTVNDYFDGCEIQAPMFTHAYINSTGTHTISLDATEFPWESSRGEDPAQYRVGESATMVVLEGPMRVAGSAPQSVRLNDCWDWISIGQGNGAPVVIASAVINIPEDHNGVVMFSAKTRFQAQLEDAGGIANLWIAIDGQGRGSTGVQQITSGSPESQRTVCASYLATGANALTPGDHTITVYASAQGSFSDLFAVKDLPLIWFDGMYGVPNPSAFALTSPQDNSDYHGITPTFSWEPAEHASSYTLTISRNRDFSDPVLTQSGITTTTCTIASPLQYNTTYYWKITAYNAAGNTDCYNPGAFTTADSANLLVNPGFEAGQTGWTVSGNDLDAVYFGPGGYSGTHQLTHWKSTPYTVYTSQSLTGLENGTYVLTAWIKNDYGNLGTAYMDVHNYGGTPLSCVIPQTSEWQMITIESITVTEGRCTIGFYSDSPASSWYYVDNVNLFKKL